MTRHKRYMPWRSGSALLFLILAGCNRNAEQGQPVSGAPIVALPLATASPPPTRYAPPASALPPVRAAAPYRRPTEPYLYLADAYAMADAFGDTPPDYAVDYYGERPWVWRADDDAYRVVEWLPEGPRYYYYEPGSDAPFLIEDPSYAYAYDDGALAGLYTLDGMPVADGLARQRSYDAARYYARARNLHRVVLNDRRHAAYAADWRERAPIIFAQRERWARTRATQPEWRHWSRTHQAREARWAPERQHRLAYASALAAAGAAGAPPSRPQPERRADRPKPAPVVADKPALFPHPRPGIHRAEPPVAPAPVRARETRLPAPEKTPRMAEKPARRMEIGRGLGIETPHNTPPRPIAHTPKAAPIEPAHSPERARAHQYRQPIPVEQRAERPHFVPSARADRAAFHAPAARPTAMPPTMPARKTPFMATPHASSRAETHMPARSPAATAPHPTPAAVRPGPDKHGRHRA